MSTFRLFISTLLSLLFSSFSPTTAQGLDSLLNSIAQDHVFDRNFSGIAIGVVKDDHITKHFSGGKYYKEIHDIDSNALFEIGSVTKLYTAYILTSLEKEKIVDRNDFLAKYLQSNITRNKGWADKITLLHLATHTSGLPAFDNTDELTEFDQYDPENPFKIFTKEFMLAELNKIDSLSTPQKVKYSNFGIGLLAYAMEQASGFSYAELFKKLIIKDLNLRKTVLYINDSNAHLLALPHKDGNLIPLIQLSDLTDAGGVKTSLTDLLKILKLHLSLSTEERSIFTDQGLINDEEIALAWGTYVHNGRKLHFHTGGTYGSASIVILDRKANLGIAIMTNEQGDHQLLKYGLSIIDWFSGK